MRKFSWVVAGASLVAASAARADHFSGTRFDMQERAHEVAVRVDRGTATLVVTRTVHNPGPKSDQALFDLEIPESAVATRLRTSSVDSAGRTTWFEGELLDAEVAAARYEKLTGIGGYYPKDPALLSWRQRGLLKLQVFPVAGKSDKTVEYTLEMPMRYEDGAYRLLLPPLGTENAPAALQVRAGDPTDALTVNGIAVVGGGESKVPGKTRSDARGGEVEISSVARAPAPVTSRLADVRLAEGRRLLHARFEAAPRLGSVPAQAAVAIVLDTSKSMAEDLPATLTALNAYLSHFTTGTVTVFTFDRTVHMPLGVDRSPADALAALQAFRPATANGSALDAALAAADQHLHASSSAPSARRILVLTDLHMRQELTGQRLASASLKSGAVVHVAHVTRGVLSNERDDDSDWAKLPRLTGGLLWTAHAAERWESEARVVFEEWARPKRIDHLRIAGLSGYERSETVLDEGQAIEHLVLASAASSAVTLTGELWSRPWQQAVSSDWREERRWSALVFGTPVADELSEAEQRVLALRGGAVSPMTSYLAIEPGVRPSTEGLERFELTGTGSGGDGRGEGIGLGGFAVRGHAAFDANAWLAPRLAAAWKRCGGRGQAIVTLESTELEVVSVDSVVVGKPDMPQQSCLFEAAWALDLPASFAAAGTSARAWKVDVRP